MITLTLKVVNKSDEVICERSGHGFVDLVCCHEYEEGDAIWLEVSEKNVHLNIQFDDALGKSLVYVTDNIRYVIPFGEKRFNRSQKIFYGERHYLFAEVAADYEVYAYRNLALNPNDQHMEGSCFPHASANVETRGESVFAAQNAIDGVRANLSHGKWPYSSWGINRRADAAMRVDFGRMVTVDKIVLYTRADFPHDSYWTQVTLRFSDGTAIDWQLEKSELAHVLDIEPKVISWIAMDTLIKAEDESPFPALTQMEVYGKVTR